MTITITRTAEPELNVAPGSVVRVRDEDWLVTRVEKPKDGTLVRAQGLSELVRDTTAAFYSAYSALDTIEVGDPGPRCCRPRWLFDPAAIRQMRAY